MSSRKSRLSLSSDVRKDAGGKTTCRTPARETSAGTKNGDVRSNDDSCEVSPSQGADYSPVISLTQDNAFHAINGVSWKWNSPQRFHGQLRMKATEGKRSSHKLHLRRPKQVEPIVEAPKQATGFNKFISKLNLLMGKENVGEISTNPELCGSSAADTLEEHYFPAAPTEQALGDETVASEDSDELLQYCIQSDDEDGADARVGAAESPIDKSGDVFEEQLIADELDDSKLDRILIEASQTVEQKLHAPSLPRPSPPAAAIPTRVTANVSIPFEMNDSDMDGFLVQASLMVEEKRSDSSSESISTSLPGANRSHQIAAPSSARSSHATNKPCTEVGRNQAQPSVQGPDDDAAAGSSEITMSQEELKALLEKKRQEALQRLQHNRLKRAMKGTNG